MRAAGRYASTFCTGTKVQVLTAASRHASTCCTGTKARVLTRKSAMRAAGSHHAARLHYGHLRKHFVVSDGPRLQDEQSPQRTFFDGWPLCLGKQAPQFFFFHSRPPVSCLIYAVLPALLACITVRTTCGRFRLTLPLHLIEPY